jgi:hypothetical protein
MPQGPRFCSLLGIIWVVCNILLAVLVPVYGVAGRYLAVIAWIIAVYHGWMCVVDHQPVSPSPPPIPSATAIDATGMCAWQCPVFACYVPTSLSLPHPGSC